MGGFMSELGEAKIEETLKELGAKVQGQDLKWGMKHTAMAGLVLSAGQFLSIHQFVYPRSEGEKLEKIVIAAQAEIQRVDTKHDAKSDRMYDKLEDIRKEIRTLIEIQLKR